MNLSLIVAVILVAVVLPWLFRRVFPITQTRETHWLEPSISTEETKPSDNTGIETSIDTHTSTNTHTSLNLLDDEPLLKAPSTDTTTELNTNKQKDLFSKQEFSVVHVIAPKEYFFVGYELLQALQNAGLNYGAKQIFHYHSDEQLENKPLFSVASAVEPGVFDLQNIGAYSTPGLTLFMDKTLTPDPHEAYDLMLQTAHQLAEELGGKVIIHG